MRKKTLNHMCDQIFWYLVYMLPMIVYLIQYLWGGTSSFVPATFEDILSSFGCDYSNIICSTLADIFTDGGILPLFNQDSIIFFFGYFASCLIAHLAVDFILFVPRLCHKWLKEFTQGD